ncbi:MAG: hypothetical protein ABW189_01420 [Rickettsiales bacterium]
MENKCYVCRNEAKIKDVAGGIDSKEIICPRCGTYWIMKTLWVAPKNAIEDEKRHIVSGYCREKNEDGYIPKFDNDNILEIQKIKKPRVEEKKNKLFLALNKDIYSMDFLRKENDIYDLKYQAISYSKSEEEYKILLNIIFQEEKLIQINPRKSWGNHTTSYYCLAPKGLMLLDSLEND